LIQASVAVTVVVAVVADDGGDVGGIVVALVGADVGTSVVVALVGTNVGTNVGSSSIVGSEVYTVGGATGSPDGGMKIGICGGSVGGPTGATGVKEGATGATGWNESVGTGFSPIGWNDSTLFTTIGSCTGFSPIGSPEGGIMMGRSDGSTDGSEVASLSLNSSPVAPKGVSVLTVTDFTVTPVLALTTRFELTAASFGVGRCDRNSLSLFPFLAATGASEGSKLTEGIVDSHHFPRTFLMRFFLSAVSLSES